MAPITKLLKKTKVFEWTIRCQIAWEDIMINQDIQAPILITPNQELKFHVDTNASQLTIMKTFAQNPTCKFDKLVMCSLKFLNSTKKHYITNLRKALAMIYALHKFIHNLLNKLLYLMSIIWLQCILLINHKFLICQQDGYCCSQNMISRLCINLVDVTQWQMP